ncbi:unnamed protein product [Amoebophrya sp. A120]|nr:unnamed protein product [Amoebophrya sp. A120]|eukprot:GSA120T00015089001.1
MNNGPCGSFSVARHFFLCLLLQLANVSLRRGDAVAAAAAAPDYSVAAAAAGAPDADLLEATLDVGGHPRVTSTEKSPLQSSGSAPTQDEDKKMNIITSSSKVAAAAPFVASLSGGGSTTTVNTIELPEINPVTARTARTLQSRPGEHEGVASPQQIFIPIQDPLHEEQTQPGDANPQTLTGNGSWASLLEQHGTGPGAAPSRLVASQPGASDAAASKTVASEVDPRWAAEQELPVVRSSDGSNTSGRVSNGHVARTFESVAQERQRERTADPDAVEHGEAGTEDLVKKPLSLSSSSVSVSSNRREVHEQAPREDSAVLALQNKFQKEEVKAGDQKSATEGRDQVQDNWSSSGSGARSVEEKEGAALLEGDPSHNRGADIVATAPTTSPSRTSPVIKNHNEEHGPPLGLEIPSTKATALPPSTNKIFLEKTTSTAKPQSFLGTSASKISTSSSVASKSNRAHGKVDVDTTVTIDLAANGLLANASGSNSSNNNSNTTGNSSVAVVVSPTMKSVAPALAPSQHLVNKYFSPLQGITNDLYNVFGGGGGSTAPTMQSREEAASIGIGSGYDLLRDERRAPAPLLTRRGNDTTQADAFSVKDAILTRTGLLVRESTGNGELEGPGYDRSDVTQSERRTPIILSRMSPYSQYKADPGPATDPKKYLDSDLYHRELIIRDDKYRILYNEEMLRARRLLIDNAKRDPQRLGLTSKVGYWDERVCSFTGNVIPLRTYVMTRVPMLDQQAKDTRTRDGVSGSYPNFRVRQVPMPEEPCLPKPAPLWNAASPQGLALMNATNVTGKNASTSSASAMSFLDENYRTAGAAAQGHQRNIAPSGSMLQAKDVAVDTAAEISFSTRASNDEVYRALAKSNVPASGTPVYDDTVPPPGTEFDDDKEFKLDYAGLAFHNVLVEQDCWMLCAQHFNCLTWKYTKCLSAESCGVTAGNCFLYDSSEVVFVPEPLADVDADRAVSIINDDFTFGFRFCLTDPPVKSFNLMPWITFSIMIVFCCMLGTLFRVSREKKDKLVAADAGTAGGAAGKNRQQGENQMRDLNTLRWSPKKGFVLKQ